MTIDVANILSKKGLPTKAYHAGKVIIQFCLFVFNKQNIRQSSVILYVFIQGLKNSERDQVQEEWMRGIVPVITATISFGMGVDKASVRYDSTFVEFSLVVWNPYE